MQLGMIGLGKMGVNMLQRLAERGHEPVGYDQSEEKLPEAIRRGGRAARSLAELADALEPPRAFWMMAQSLFARFASRQEDSFSARVIAALRKEFGGHAIRAGL